MKNIFTPDRVNYILRTYLPAWNYATRIEEIVRFCKETGTRHVMLFTDAQHIAWNQLTLNEARLEAANIVHAKQRLAEEDIRVGINSSYNQMMSRWDHRKHNNYDYWATYADGTCEHRVPCLLDPILDDYLRNYYTILAEIGPDYIYVDDDHRYMLNGQKNTWGCFCELHLRKFGEVTGKAWTRESLNVALLNNPDIRTLWIEFLGTRLVEIAGIIRTTIHAVNPAIKAGMMVPCIHPLPTIGHTIENMVRAFSPDGSPLVRPCIGPYNDHNRRQIIPGLFYLQFTTHLLGDNAEYTPEIETDPYTRFSKSMTTVRFHIVQGLLNRMNNPAISLCGYTGDSPFLESTYIDFLKNSRSYFNGVRKIAPAKGTGKGIQLIWDFDSAAKTPHAISSVSELYWPAFVLHDILGNTGFNCTYDESPIRFLAGDTAYALSEQRIAEILCSGLVLDATAARALAERGFADIIGVAPGDKITGFGGEECVSEKYFGTYTGNYIPLLAAPTDGIFNLNPAAGVKEISVIVDHDRTRIAPGIVLFENKSGGKIAVLPYKISSLDSNLRHFICYQRQYMFRRIFDWMSQEATPVFVEHPSDFAVQCWDDGKRLTCCLTNLSYDDADHIIIKLNGGVLFISDASFMTEDGNMAPLSLLAEDLSSSVETKWRIRKSCHIFTPFIIVIEKSNKNADNGL